MSSKGEKEKPRKPQRKADHDEENEQHKEGMKKNVAKATKRNEDIDKIEIDDDGDAKYTAADIDAAAATAAKEPRRKSIFFQFSDPKMSPESKEVSLILYI